uniref:Uncharacterized protein n=1 Tax=Cacopsylla melanoneura TaxID=428564 RepID=A0A8D8VBQ0_9HEMI
MTSERREGIEYGLTCLSNVSGSKVGLREEAVVVGASAEVVDTIRTAKISTPKHITVRRDVIFNKKFSKKSFDQTKIKKENILKFCFFYSGCFCTVYFFLQWLFLYSLKIKILYLCIS